MPLPVLGSFPAIAGLGGKGASTLGPLALLKGASAIKGLVGPRAQGTLVQAPGAPPILGGRPGLQSITATILPLLQLLQQGGFDGLAGGLGNGLGGQQGTGLTGAGAAPISGPLASSLRLLLPRR